jgi:hypothetical protein
MKALEWNLPTDTDANSTNCLLNAYANLVHKERLGFHPYALEISCLVMEGCISREDALAKLSIPPYEKVISYIKNKLGINN